MVRHVPCAGDNTSEESAQVFAAVVRRGAVTDAGDPWSRLDHIRPPFSVRRPPVLSTTSAQLLNGDSTSDCRIRFIVNTRRRALERTEDVIDAPLCFFECRTYSLADAFLKSDGYGTG